ncbi:MAG: multicopper oxidase domain-containing protein [Planctomycetota bacterium]
MAGLGQNISSNFSMRARMNGFTTIQDSPVQLWYFDVGASNSGFMSDRFLPSAHIEIIEGELTSIQLQNQSNMDHTIHLHGLDVDQANDGVESTSTAVRPFQSFTYQFIAPQAGTYHYHCHIDTVVHYQRGMAGAIIVRPPGGETDLAWVGGPRFDEEVLWHLSTYDLAWEAAQGSGPLTARHRPGVFLLNGRETEEARQCPFTIVRMRAGDTCYLRVVNQAYQFARFNLGGIPFEVVASDGRPMPKPITADSWEIGTGERYDILFRSTRPGTRVATIDYLDDYTGAPIGQVSTLIQIQSRFGLQGRLSPKKP